MSTFNILADSCGYVNPLAYDRCGNQQVACAWRGKHKADRCYRPRLDCDHCIVSGQSMTFAQRREAARNA